MSEFEKEKIRKKYTALAMSLLGLIAIFMIFSIVVLKRITAAYNVVVIIGLTAFWAIMDIVIPIKTQAFEGKTDAQISAYKKYAAADLLGYVGLMYFALAAQRNTGIYGAIVYLFSRILRNRFQEEYQGAEEDETAGDEAAQAVTQDETAGDGAGQIEAQGETAGDGAGQTVAEDETAGDDAGQIEAQDETADED